MSLTTFKNSQTITAVDYKYFRKNIIFTFSDGKKLVMKAISECCSRSFFKEETGYEFSSLIGEKILSFKGDLSISFSERNAIEETVRRFKGHKFILESGKDFKFFLVNDSNGWYTGWIEIEGADVVREDIEEPDVVREDIEEPSTPAPTLSTPVKSTLNPFAKPFVPTKKLNPNSKIFVPSV